MRRPLLAVALAATLVLSGCAGASGSAYPAAVRDQLQTTVLDITTAASQNDLQGALNHLNDLKNELQEARDSGDISEPRYNAVVAAIAVLEAKITAKMAAAGQTPTPQPTKSTSNGSTGTKRTQAPTDTSPEPSDPQQGASHSPPASQAPPASSAPAEPEPSTSAPAPTDTPSATPSPSPSTRETTTPDAEAADIAPTSED
jgi:hypothetical protein